MKLANSHIGWLAAAFALAVLPACGRYDDLCKKNTECYGGNDKDEAACVESAEGQENVAAAYGCSEQFDKYYECLSDKYTCVKATDPSTTYVDPCAAESKALSVCKQAASQKSIDVD